ncbi:TetR/AcrR family transcriptional regulator [Sphingomonas oligophenolica]|uniref:TetR/AcrR family transcriptional regulator n=1 Tax=Sphingomonas oligophenolica TaxID=301154 RepID=A0ABU9XYE4_9SPHN
MSVNPAPLEPAASPFRSTRTTIAERGQKRAALLLAAVRMFNERGFHATSLEDVATSLGVTKPVIYHHLGNKDQVLLECVTMGLGELQAAVEEARAGPGNGLDRLRAFLCRYAEVIMGEFGRCVIRTGDEVLSPAARTRFRALKREIDDALRGMIEEAVKDGSARAIDVRVTANAFAGALNWPARWYRPDGVLAPADMAAALVDILIAGVENRAGQ